MEYNNENYWNFDTLGEFYIPDGTGKIQECVFKVRREIPEDNKIADLFVYHGWTIALLWDDEKFIENIQRTLRSIGYKGQEFGRAELGMQDRRITVLEGGELFKEFLFERLNRVGREEPKIDE